MSLKKTLFDYEASINQRCNDARRFVNFMLQGGVRSSSIDTNLFGKNDSSQQRVKQKAKSFTTHVKRKTTNNNNNNTNKKIIKQDPSPPFMSIATKVGFIEEINKKLPACLNVVVKDTTVKNDDKNRIENKNLNQLNEHYRAMMKALNFSKCTYDEVGQDAFDCRLGMFLILNDKTCVCGLEMRDRGSFPTLDLYARTHSDFFHQKFYTFLIAVLIFYMGKYTSNIFESYACNIASSYVLKKFKQNMQMEKRINGKWTMTSICTEDMDERTPKKTIIDNNWNPNMFIGITHSIIPSDKVNLKIALNIILSILKIFNSPNKCKDLNLLLNSTSSESSDNDINDTPNESSDTKVVYLAL